MFNDRWQEARGQSGEGLSHNFRAVVVLVLWEWSQWLLCVFWGRWRWVGRMILQSSFQVGRVTPLWSVENAVLVVLGLTVTSLKTVTLDKRVQELSTTLCCFTKWYDAIWGLLWLKLYNIISTVVLLLFYYRFFWLKGSPLAQSSCQFFLETNDWLNQQSTFHTSLLFKPSFIFPVCFHVLLYLGHIHKPYLLLVKVLYIVNVSLIS